MVVVFQSAGLVLVHAHSRLVSVTDDNTTVTAVTSSHLVDGDRVIEPDVPFWLFCLHRYLSALSLYYQQLYILGDFTFWISLSLSLKFQTETELNPKSEMTFLIWTQRIAERKLSPTVNLSLYAVSF